VIVDGCLWGPKPDYYPPNITPAFWPSLAAPIRKVLDAVHYWAVRRRPIRY